MSEDSRNPESNENTDDKPKRSNPATNKNSTLTGPFGEGTEEKGSERQDG